MERHGRTACGSRVTANGQTTRRAQGGGRVTYKKTSAAEQYFTRTASRSIRPFKSGHSDQGTEPIKIRPSFRNQYDTLKTRKRDIDKSICEMDRAWRAGTTDLTGLDYHEERKRLISIRADVIRQKGNMAKTMREASRMKFEKIFVNVANAKLPKDTFLVIVEEAREIWRGQGWAELVPGPTNRERRKAQKKLGRVA